MKPMDTHDFELPTTPVAPRGGGVLRRIAGMLETLGHVARPRPGLDRLPARLRRDAGIGEAEIDRSRAARAPLIR